MFRGETTARPHRPIPSHQFIKGLRHDREDRQHAWEGPGKTGQGRMSTETGALNLGHGSQRLGQWAIPFGGQGAFLEPALGQTRHFLGEADAARCGFHV